MGKTYSYKKFREFSDPATDRREMENYARFLKELKKSDKMRKEQEHRDKGLRLS